MLPLAALLFLLVLVSGVSHMLNDVKHRPVKVWHRWVHGGSAGIFMLLLVIESTHSGIAIRIVTALFLGVLLAGIILFWNYLQKKPLPFMLALIHGLMGIVGYILLLASLGT